MPYKIKFERPPAGIAVNSARCGENVAVQRVEFTSSEDGQVFIHRLETIVDSILKSLEPQVSFRRSEIDHLLAFIEADGNAIVYVNELRRIDCIRINRPCEQGEAIFKSDIVDYKRVSFDGITVPDTAGVVYLFSAGWRKGLFFDFSQIGHEPQPRRFDCETLFGQFYGYVLFQERFAITEHDWSTLLAEKWFPFAALPHELIDELLRQIRAGWDSDEVLQRIANNVRSRVDELISGWRGYSVFAPHLEILERAIERFKSDDFVSCAGLLYPRIEGILRSNLRSVRPMAKPTQTRLSESAVVTIRDNQRSLLLPHRFQQYLEQVYFAGFDPASEENDISRNSVAHGVADAGAFSRKAAVIAILIVHQLYYSLGSDVSSPTSDRNQDDIAVS